MFSTGNNMEQVSLAETAKQRSEVQHINRDSKKQLALILKKPIVNHEKAKTRNCDTLTKHVNPI